ncbi:MAG: hypothetical protein ACYS3N_22245, partial [Planctomycetota bacterium]
STTPYSIIRLAISWVLSLTNGIDPTVKEERRVYAKMIFYKIIYSVMRLQNRQPAKPAHCCLT